MHLILAPDLAIMDQFGHTEEAKVPTYSHGHTEKVNLGAYTNVHVNGMSCAQAANSIRTSFANRLFMLSSILLMKHILRSRCRLPMQPAEQHADMHMHMRTQTCTYTHTHTSTHKHTLEAGPLHILLRLRVSQCRHK